MKKMYSKYFIAFVLLVMILLPASELKAQTDDEVYDYTDEMPSFKGDYQQFLVENLIYPEEAVNNNIQGTVYAEILVQKDGKVSDVIIKKDPGAGLGEEVKRVIYLMPDWEPGEQNGEPVITRITIPVKFYLSSEKDKKQNSEEKE